MNHDHSQKEEQVHPKDDHDHHPGHSHDHSHAPKDFNLAFKIGVLLNMMLVVVQVAFGFIAHSLALVADAGHNFADVLGLMLAWWASKLLKSTPTPKHTYGLRSVSILAALTNAVLLLVTMGAVAWEAIVRLENPPAVSGKIVIWVAAAGIVINSVTALSFFSGRKDDLNIRGAFLHLAADAARELRERFRIPHATLQIEHGDPAHPCQLAAADVV